MRRTLRKPGPRKRPSPSIRRTVLLLFAASVAAAVLLLSGYEAAVSSWFRGETNVLTRLLGPQPSFARSSASADELTRRFNVALLARPVEGAAGGQGSAAGGQSFAAGGQGFAAGGQSSAGAAHSSEFLETLARDARPNLGIALKVNGEIIFESPPLPPGAAAALPAFSSLERPEPFEFDAEERLLVVRQLDFLSADGAKGSFYILRPPRPEPPRLPFPRQLSFIAAIILLAADGAAGVYFILRATGPLKKLEEAALRMSGGDLATPVQSDSRFAELGSAFAALETARERIALLMSRERAEEENRRELIANLSHDLRTPLAAVRGYVDGLKDGVADTPEKAARYLDVASSKIRILDEMIGEILLLSTLEAGTAPLETRPIELVAFLRAGIEELRLAYTPDRASITGTVLELSGTTGTASGTELEVIHAPAGTVLEPESGLRALAEPQALRRVIENLVENSVRHGGKAPVAIRVALVREGDHALIRVEDDGRGIPASERERIFERFYRGEAERPAGGAGLGLAIARNLVEAMGGSIRAAEVQGGGAALEIRLRLVEGGAA